ncbi:MAG: leucine-rich repeat domain-containing protein [Candidatus Paceibacterota bacterium]
MNKLIFIIYILIAIIVLQNTGFLKTINNLDIVKVNILTFFKSKDLDLSNQSLKTIPVYVFDQANLENLNISHNYLSGTIPAEIRNLVNLKTLNASNNLMSGVPAEIGQLQNLEFIDLSNNQIVGLPYELGDLKNLKVLNLSGNKYSQQDLDYIRSKLPSAVNIITN